MCNCKSLLHIHSFNQGGGCAAAGQSPVCQIHIWQCKCKSPLHTHHPFNQGGRCAAAGKLLAKEPELKAYFSRAQGAGSNAKANKVARFLPNPEANWGPKPKHGRAVKVCNLCTLCMFQSNFLHSHQTPASLSPYISDCCPVIFKPLGFSALPFPAPPPLLNPAGDCPVIQQVFAHQSGSTCTSMHDSGLVRTAKCSFVHYVTVYRADEEPQAYGYLCKHMQWWLYMSTSATRHTAACALLRRCVIIAQLKPSCLAVCVRFCCSCCRHVLMSALCIMTLC